ncbi:rod shape-determining protein MreD [Sphingomonas sp.]|uniref:rod shape-determining protein MreD n=1 Tax=Sphingomonas sp. TaxID=28214 RepID=UPI002DD640B8|nr:rod shape-determining protein MreD [Sphingomonas sp.]
MRAKRPSRFGEPASPRRRTAIAAATVMAGSLLTAIPIVAPVPLLPPFGLLMLLAWRLRSPDALPVWAGVPLGLFDDLLSGQPLGSAMSLWTLALIAIDMLDSQLVWRNFWQDWMIAAAGVAAFLIGSRLAGTPLGAHVDTVLLLQIAVSAALYPLAALLCARAEPPGAEAR